MNRRIGIVLGRFMLVALLGPLAVVGPPDMSRTTTTPAHAQTSTGTLLKTVSIPSEAQNCPGGTETSVSAIPARMVGMTDNQKVLLGVSCLANSVPSNSSQQTSLRTIYYLDTGAPVPSSNPQSSTVVKSIVTPLTAADPPSTTFLGWGALTTRVDKGDVAACSNTSDNKHAVYKVDVSPFTSTADGTAVKLFDLPAGAAGCDGLAWDPGDNSIFQSFENATTIAHYSQTGVVLSSITTPAIPTGFPGAGTQCQASGLAMAGPSLYVACGSSTTMLQITKDFPTAGVVASNTIASGHQLQDAECDPSWPGMDAIWSKDKVNNQLYAFQVPNFSCGFRTGDPTTAPAPAKCPAGSSPSDVTIDTDGDGLPDCWENAGIDYDGDGVTDYQLPWNSSSSTTAPQRWLGPRPDPRHKDVYLEMDFMDALNLDQQAAIDDIIAAFNAAPVTITKPDGTTAPMNPDGTAGIHLHIQVDELLDHKTNLAFEPCTGPLTDPSTTADFDVIKSSKFGTAAERAAGPAQVNAKRFAFRYLVLGHQLLGQGTTSGCSEVFGNDLVVTPGLWTSHGVRGMLNGTIMHELGHALGLRHGGGDNTNCKPNYLSVMSYGRQVDGQPIPGRKLDYSRQKLATLDESALNEPDGIKLGVDPTTLLALALDQTAYGVPKKPSGANVFVVGANLPWNLNSDTNVTDIHLTADPNNLGSTDCNGAGTILDGFDDWSHLQFNFQDSFEFADGVAASACTSDPSGFTTCGRDRLTDKNDFTQLDAPKVSEIKKELTKDEADAIAANAAPLFTITMTDSPDPVKQGQQLTYTVTVQNKGPKTGTDVTVTDTLPPSTGTASADFVSARSSSGSCAQASGVVTCNLGSVAVGSNATVTIVVKSKGEGTLTNSAGVSSDPDPTLVQSQVSQTTTATKGGP